MSSPEALSARAAGEFALGGRLRVNRIGFGAMRITGPGIWGDPPSPEGALTVLRRAIELGVNLIDTADSYGPEVSENLIARALRPYPDDLVLATKGGLTRGGPGAWAPDGSPDHLRQACEGSLRRLGLDCIDLYQLHRPDPAIPYEESVGTLAELREEGKLRLIGVSNVSLEELDRARSVTEVVSVQNRLNVYDRDSMAVLVECERSGLAFLPWAPLASGGATGGGGALRAVARESGMSEAQVAIAWLLQASPVAIPIPGTSSVAHLDANVAAAGRELTERQVARLRGAAPSGWTTLKRGLRARAAEVVARARGAR